MILTDHKKYMSCHMQGQRNSTDRYCFMDITKLFSGQKRKFFTQRWSTDIVRAGFAVPVNSMV